MFRVAAKRAAEGPGSRVTGEWSRRSITSGSCLATEGLEVQAARPWDQVGTNAAVDHAEAVASLFAADRKVALFAVPAPFTGTCTNEHVPGFVANADAILAKCDELICFSVSCPYANDGWAKAMGVDQSKIKFVSDVDGSVSKAWDVTKDYS
eukprot:CAMPEP_0119474900 /NCGR_PEP_ID=MMETSP1344-20130328/5977_1 /TAXON_ID=236787 /ORGANISM="Florenciella parvula, Strain CCMP2471" /LENGTH=151 /DNA_ID=CAMNT_0007508285 /DNA_START=1 /DNA_END=456 /DNA_ORIENTATION=+